MMTTNFESFVDPDENGGWGDRAEELVEWTERVLINRADVYGGQFVDAQGEIKRTTWDDLNREVLEYHYSATQTQFVIGVHCTAPDETCRWIGVDIDAHDGQGASPDSNFAFARLVEARAVGASLDVRLLDSSGGRGGYHLWILLGGPRPMAEARRLALWLVTDWEAHGLPRRPDLFPGNDQLTGKRCGTWLRLPGRHHKRPSWARVWSPSCETWLAGGDAVDSLLSLRGDPAVAVAAIVPADFVGTPANKAVHRARIPKIAPGRPLLQARRASSTQGRQGVAAPGRNLQLARAALEHYPNLDLDYDDWLEIAMALKNLEDKDAAFELWDEWSSASAKYDPILTEEKWQSLRPADEVGGIGLATLFHRAMVAGWPGPGVVEIEDPRGFRIGTNRSRSRGTITFPVARRSQGRPRAQND